MSQAAKAPDRLAARMKALEDHIRFESSRDLESLIGTFGDDHEWHHKPSNYVLTNHRSVIAQSHGQDAVRSSRPSK